MINTEHMITLCVAVQKAQEKEWLASYESIGNVRAREECTAACRHILLFLT